jgi:oligoribonuclease NrnB/cAMP/cGMP phosphodiesterase (DHH superfamily)
MNTYVIYHKNCYDGFGAAFCAWKIFRDGAIYIPMAYGEKLPEIPDYSFVYVLDFSFPRDILEELRSRKIYVLVLDHHKTAEENLKGLSYFIFDNNRSGAKITFDYFSERTPALEPYKTFVDYISDRDLWKNELPHTNEFHAALSSYPRDFKIWDEIGKSPSKLIEEGGPILRHINTTVGMMCDQTFYSTKFLVLGCGVVPCVNATGYWNEVCHELLARNPQFPFVTTFFKRADGKTQWSLRSRTTEDFDVTRIAKEFGGGGHKHASGFTE